MDNVTIREVAKAAGVAVSTVSRAFNNYSDINQDTRANILKIADEMGYKPNIIAKSLSSNLNYRLGMLIEDYTDMGIPDPIVFETLMSFKNVATKLGYETVLLSTTSDMQKSQSLKRLVADKNIDALFCMGLKLTDSYFKELNEISFPCCLLDIDTGNNNVICVGVDNTKGAFKAVEYLINLGHKKIGFINGHKDAFVSYERLDGYYLALNRYGIQVDNNLIVHSDFTDKGGACAAKDLVEKNKDMTAVFCASDLMAVGAMDSLNSLGFSIPDDISVVGFDDIYIAQFVTPKLTTIRQNRQKIGEIAASTLVNMIGGQSMGRVVIEPELVIRDSAKNIV